MTLWHIEFGDGDDFFTISESKEEAISKMPEGQEMVRGVTKLDGLYQMILQQGRREVVEWGILPCNEHYKGGGLFTRRECPECWKKLKEWGL